MPIRCVERPNRKHIRSFSLKDLERIAKYVGQEGGNPWLIVFSIIAGLGLGAGICRFVGSMKRVVSIWTYLQAFIKVKIVLIGFLALLQFIIKSPVRWIPVVNTALLIAVAVLLSFSVLFDKLLSAVADALLVGDFANILAQGCDFIGEKVDDVADEIPDALPDFPDFPDDLNPLE